MVSVGVVGAILLVPPHLRPGTHPSPVALGLLLGGALGNMADRFRLGYVVDFVDVGLGGFRFYTFNVADRRSAGAILLLS